MKSFVAKLLFASLLMTTPALLQAQVVAQSLMTDTSFNAADCSSDALVQASFQYTGTSTIGSQYDIFVATATPGQELTVCNNRPSGSGTLVEGQSLAVDGLVELPGDHEIKISELLSSNCSGDGARETLYLCMRVTSAYSTYGEGGGFALDVDTEIPGQPTGVVWGVGDGEVVLNGMDSLSAVESDEVLNYHLELRACDVADMMDAGTGDDAALTTDAANSDSAVDLDAGNEDATGDAGVGDASVGDTSAVDTMLIDDASVQDAAIDDAAVSVSSCDAPGDFAEVASGPTLPLRADGLHNGAAYEVRVYVVDEAGNQGPVSDSVVLVPQVEYGFWDIYAGSETGSGETSCAQTSPASAWFLLMLPILFLLWRRRRHGRQTRLLPMLLVVLSFSLAHNAKADPLDFNLHLSGGPYLPQIDSEAGANGAYSCVFGDDPWLLAGVGGDLILFDYFGTLSLGAELNYFTKGGKERDAAPSSGGCGAATGSTNTLHILPVMANVQYRFDWLYKMWGFPLAPYGRIGVNATPWALSRNGLLENTGGSITGFRTGWQWAAGLALVLDIFDPAGMAKVREEGTFQHSYLFAEWRDMHIDGFSTPGFILSDQTWVAGVSVDF